MFADWLCTVLVHKRLFSGSEYMVGLLSLPEQSHLAAFLRSFNRVPNYLGDIR